MYAADYRREARAALKGKWKRMSLLMILAQLAMMLFGVGMVYQLFFSRPYYLDVGVEGFYYVYYLPVGIGWLVLALIQALTLVAKTVTIGQYRIANALLSNEETRVRLLFPLKLVFKAFVMNLLRSLLVGLQAILLIIPGIIAMYRYSMADYLLAENPQLGPVEVLRESRQRMMGHKAALFSLDLSFLGWTILLMALVWIAERLGMNRSAESLWLLPDGVNLLLGAPLAAYTLMAHTLFYRDITGTQRAQAQADEPQPEASEAREGGFTVPDADETVARDIFMGCGCSRNRLREEGLLEGYEKLRPSPVSEERWKREYASRLMRSFDQEPDILKDILALAAEYSMDDLLSRALERIERHIRQQTLPWSDILNMCGQVLATLTSGAFDENEGFIQRRKQQILEMADRLEAHLRQQAGEESWRQSLEYIRQMCS